MKKIYEFIPNISTSDITILNMFKQIVSDEYNCKLLDYSYDTSHNRAVFTIIGTYEALKKLSIRFVRCALENIDIYKHKGVHPFVGSIDVMPFVPLKDATIEDAVKLSKEVALLIYETFNIPIYLYGYSEEREYRNNLSTIRNKGIEGLKQKIKDEKWFPNYGKNLHETFGAICIGCRDYLIAYNINLDSDDYEFVKEVALEIRQSGGIFKGVKSLGLKICDNFNVNKSHIQVSINLVDFNQTSIYEIYSYVEKRASEKNIKIINSELIGMIPQKALTDSFCKSVKLNNIDSQILDNNLEIDFLDYSIDEFLDVLSKAIPTPGGGSVAGLVGCLSLGLMNMVSNYTLNKEKYINEQNLVIDSLKKINKLLEKMKELIMDDVNAYNLVSNAFKLPKQTEEEKQYRQNEIIKATKEALIPPFEVCVSSFETLKLLDSIYDKFNINLISDFGVSVTLIKACFDSGYLNYYINAKAIGFEYLKDELDKLDNMHKFIELTVPKIYNNIIGIIKNS